MTNPCLPHINSPVHVPLNKVNIQIIITSDKVSFIFENTKDIFKPWMTNSLKIIPKTQNYTGSASEILDKIDDHTWTGLINDHD